MPSLGSWQTWFTAAGIDAQSPAPAIAVESQSLLYAAAAQGLGVALGSRDLLQGYLASGQLVQLLAVECQIPPSLGYTVSDRGNGRLARAFATWVTDAVAKDA